MQRGRRGHADDGVQNSSHVGALQDQVLAHCSRSRWMNWSCVGSIVAAGGTIKYATKHFNSLPPTGTQIRLNILYFPEFRITPHTRTLLFSLAQARQDECLYDMFGVRIFRYGGVSGYQFSSIKKFKISSTDNRELDYLSRLNLSAVTNRLTLIK